MKALAIIIFLCFSISISAQKIEKCACSKKDKIKVSEFFENLKEQNSFIAECEEQVRKSQIEESGRISPKIAGECHWGNNGCPIKLVKPVFPKQARRLKLSGSIEVEIITDEKGKVIYAKAISGNIIFYANAEKAACLSRFYPKTFCGKEVMQKRIIVYNFIP